MPAFHTISCQGPMTTILRLHYHAVPSAIEYLFVTESIDIKHSEGTFQRTIVVDANKERLSVSFNVRKFDGPSDTCGYGGIRMFNEVKASYSFDDKHTTIEAYILHTSIGKKLHKRYVFTKESKYFPICTNRWSRIKTGYLHFSNCSGESKNFRILLFFILFFLFHNIM